MSSLLGIAIHWTVSGSCKVWSDWLFHQVFFLECCLLRKEGNTHIVRNISVPSIARTKNSDLIPKKGRQEFFFNKSHTTLVLGIHVTASSISLDWYFSFNSDKAECFGFSQVGLVYSSFTFQSPRQKIHFWIIRPPNKYFKCDEDK